MSTEVFDSREVIVVEKHVFVDGGIDDDGEPLVSFIYSFGQDFSQTPEPSTCAMVALGIGLVGRLTYRTRRREAARR